MKSRYSFYDTIWNKDLETNYKGFSNKDLSSIFLTNKDILYEIPIKYQYRPDLIAYEFYGDSKISWVLIFSNNISDSPEGFYVGRQIRIPHVSKIVELLA